jgi:hypothetical protein
MMKTVRYYILILFSTLLSTYTYSQNCSRQIASFDAAPGGYTITGAGQLESVNNAITLYFNEYFGTQSGPDLHVYLAIHFEAPSTPGNTNVDLGELSSNSGAQSYSVPSGVSLGDYSYILIHCKSFNHWWGGGLLGDIQCTTATNNANSDVSTTIYPNPSKGIIYFPTLEPGTRIQIYNLSGNLILSENGINAQQLDLTQFGTGIYLLKLSDEKGSRITRVVVE